MWDMRRLRLQSLQHGSRELVAGEERPFYRLAIARWCRGLRFRSGIVDQRRRPVRLSIAREDVPVRRDALHRVPGDARDVADRAEMARAELALIARFDRHRNDADVLVARG